MRISILTLFVAVCFSPLNLHARVVEDLTLARVPVADRSDIEFARGTSKALEAVLVKLTGSSRTTRTAGGRAVLAKAKRLVQQFGYEKSSRDNEAQDLLLRVAFDAPALTEEMRNQGLVLWGKERPATRLYVIVKNGDMTSMVTSDSLAAETAEAEVAEIIARQAFNRGIPVSFPGIAKTALIETQRNISEVLATALEIETQTDVDGVAVGIFEASPSGLWESRWVFQMGNERGKFSGQGDLIALLAEENTDSLADAIGRRFANPTLLGHKESVRLKVHGIFDSSDYANVTRYLRSLDSVTDLFLQQAEGDAIILSASVQGGYAGLNQSIAFGKVLAPISTAGGIGEGAQESDNTVRPGEYRLIVR